MLFSLSGTFGTESSPVALTFSQLYWISAIVFLVGSIVSGTARVVVRTFDPNELWNVLEKYRVSTKIYML